MAKTNVTAQLTDIFKFSIFVDDLYKEILGETELEVTNALAKVLAREFRVYPEKIKLTKASGLVYQGKLLELDDSVDKLPQELAFRIYDDALKSNAYKEEELKIEVEKREKERLEKEEMEAKALIRRRGLYEKLKKEFEEAVKSKD